MKIFLGYAFLGGGFAAIAVSVADTDGMPEWHAWIVVALIILGLVLVFEDYKETTIKEMRKELDEKIEEKLEEMRG